MDNIITQMKEAYAQRIGMPLFASYAIAWCLINYKTVFILLSDVPVYDKLALVEFSANQIHYGWPAAAAFAVPLVGIIGTVWLEVVSSLKMWILHKSFEKSILSPAEKDRYLKTLRDKIAQLEEIKTTRETDLKETRLALDVAQAHCQAQDEHIRWLVRTVIEFSLQTEPDHFRSYLDSTSPQYGPSYRYRHPYNLVPPLDNTENQVLTNARNSQLLLDIVNLAHPSRGRHSPFSQEERLIPFMSYLDNKQNAKHYAALMVAVINELNIGRARIESHDIVLSYIDSTLFSRLTLLLAEDSA